PRAQSRLGDLRVQQQFLPELILWDLVEVALPDLVNEEQPLRRLRILRDDPIVRLGIGHDCGSGRTKPAASAPPAGLRVLRRLILGKQHTGYAKGHNDGQNLPAHANSFVTPAILSPASD